jgi:predicted XRE-type DNA-binding protein
MPTQAHLKAKLIRHIGEWVRQSGLSQREAAHCLDIEQPALNEIIQGRSRYALGWLIDAWVHSGGECDLVCKRKRP